MAEVKEEEGVVVVVVGVVGVEEEEEEKARPKRYVINHTYEDMIDHRIYTHNFSSCSGVICFQASISQLLKLLYITVMINPVFISFSAVQIYDI